MSTRRIAGVVCLVLAVAALIANLGALSQGPAISDPSGLGVSHAVGVFLPTLGLLIVGLWLLQKPKAHPKS